ncbi:hypothetical protein QOZ80_4AG0302450 [Eleusine coracana subsp. coracana]|nr:hypothetical protein QOZ80_4AG0302450 [Eleusine coracana subsp. coracana]
MSLRHASKVLFRAAQAVRVTTTRQPAPTRAMPGAAKAPPAAHHRQQGGQNSVGGLTGVSAAEKAVALETVRRRKAAEKAEKVVHLVCWGPN